MNKILYIVIFVCISLSLEAQEKKDVKSLINGQEITALHETIKIEVISHIINMEKDFFKNHKLRKSEISDYYIKEIFLSDDNRNRNKFYVFIPSSSHSNYYLLLINAKNYQVLNFRDFNNLLSKTLLFYKKINLNHSTQYAYTLEILKYYKLNYDSIYNYVNN